MEYIELVMAQHQIRLNTLTEAINRQRLIVEEYEVNVSQSSSTVSLPMPENEEGTGETENDADSGEVPKSNRKESEGAAQAAAVVPPHEHRFLRLKQQEFQWYERQYQQLQQLLSALHLIRLEGGFFPVVPVRDQQTGDRLMNQMRKMSRTNLSEADTKSAVSFEKQQSDSYHELLGKFTHVLFVTATGTLYLMDLEHFTTTLHALMENKECMTPFSEFILQTFEKKLKLCYPRGLKGPHSNAILYADQLRSVRLLKYDSGLDLNEMEKLPGTLSMIKLEYHLSAFNHHLKHLFLMTLDAEEAVETIGAHIRHHNHKRIQNVKYIKSLYALKKRKFDEDSDECKNLLRRLYSAVFPAESIPEDGQLTRNTLWTRVGFQNERPSTDFRGMGLLGLWVLVYLAERSAGIHRPLLTGQASSFYTTLDDDYFIRPLWVQKMVECESSSGMFSGSRNYPWAVAGINMLSMIMHKFFSLNDTSVENSPTENNWSTPAMNLLCYLEPKCADAPSAAGSLPASIPNTSSNSTTDLTKTAFFSPLRIPPQGLPSTTQAHETSDELWRCKLEMTSIEEMFCFCMEFLDRLYLESEASYMDFPVIMQQVEAEVNQWLNAPNKLLNDTKIHKSIVHHASPQRHYPHHHRGDTHRRFHSNRDSPSKDESTTPPYRPTSLPDLWELLNLKHPIMKTDLSSNK